LVLAGVSSRGENHSSGIRFVPGKLIRFHGGFYSSKVKQSYKIVVYFLAVTRATRILNPRVALVSFGQISPLA
jgi:hypothetical protein